MRGHVDMSAPRNPAPKHRKVGTERVCTPVTGTNNQTKLSFNLIYIYILTWVFCPNPQLIEKFTRANDVLFKIIPFETPDHTTTRHARLLV